MKNEYRIVTVPRRPQYFAVEIRYWWAFWWVELNSDWFNSIEDAEKFANNHADPVVKRLGRLPPD
jgi:hypothetical protein